MRDLLVAMSSPHLRALLPAACAAGLAATAPAGAGRQEPLVAVSVTFDPGRDLGQNFGSLFEATDARGRVVLGAGFPGAYNTRFRADRHTVQFFVRPPVGEQTVRMRRLPRPDDDCGLYPFDFDGKLYAINESTGRFFHEWDPAASGWRRATGPVAPLGSTNDGLVRVGPGIMRWVGGRVEYDGRLVLAPPPEGRYNHFYYARGRLYFYHTQRGEGGAASTRIVSCPWTPEDTDPIDAARGDALPVSPPGSVTWAWGQHGEQVLTVTNYGGVYAHDARGWRTLREPSPGVSYQVYSMVTHYDRLLLGHYPTGEVLEFDGESLKQREGFPPRLPGVSPSARECQTLAIYRGDLFAGVWPWGEVWRHERDGDRWHSLGRLFTHPEVTDRVQHPYETEAQARGLVLNDWGQRVTGMVPVGDSLMLTTSAKGNHRWDPKYDFLSATGRLEYGAIHQWTLPGTLAVPIHWKDGATRLEFLLFRERLAVRQDGRPLMEAALDPAFSREVKPARVAWGQGVFGPLQGRLVRTRTRGVSP